MSVLEISERLPKPKGAGASKRAKYNPKRIELAVAAEMMKRHPRQRNAPTPPLRPIQDDGTVAKVGHNMLLDVVMPDGAIGIHEQDVPTTKTPPRPNHNAQADAGEGEKYEYKRDDDKH
jgi:hypothetical protein